MSALEVPMPELDRQRIENMVADYRRSLETLYTLAYLQGEVASDRARLERMKSASPYADRRAEPRYGTEHDTSPRGGRLVQGS